MVEPEQVRSMFAKVAGRYDLCNRVLSFRRDIYWRRRMVSEMRFFRTMRYLDLACGTGDVALEVAGKFTDVKVLGLDFVPEMISEAHRKIERAGLADRVQAEVGDATAVTCSDGSFDCVGIAFGIRNIPERLTALREMRRLVVDGGRVLVLELVMPENAFLRMCYRPLLRFVLPLPALIFGGDKSAYSYLGRSINEFPKAAEFENLMREAGLRDVYSTGLTFGVCRLFVGVR
jgi:demethylmenaquinone methyltransferase/2-methoxy-6-polyprenyl-1,4-benzoquinol methylase